MEQRKWWEEVYLRCIDTPGMMPPHVVADFALQEWSRRFPWKAQEPSGAKNDKAGTE
jgi:hypothetical protein